MDGDLVVKKIKQSCISAIIIKKGKELSDEERREIGNKMIELVQKYGIKYNTVTTEDKHFNDDNSECYETSESIFPVNLYRESFETLNEVLKNPCKRSTPHEHKGGIDFTEITTLDLWASLHEDKDKLNIMANSKRIRDLAAELECPYDLLGHELSNEIVDWVCTDECLGWIEEERDRKLFVEDGKHERLEGVEGHLESQEMAKNHHQYVLFGDVSNRTGIDHLPKPVQNVYIDTKSSLNDIYGDVGIEKLLEILEEWLNEAVTEREKESLLDQCHKILNKFGTTNDYKIIRLADCNYLISYQGNKDSIDYLEEAISYEHNRYNLPPPTCTSAHGWTLQDGRKLTFEEYTDKLKCRCGKSSGEHIGKLDYKHLSLLESELCAKTKNYRFENRKLISEEELKDLIQDICPEELLETHLESLFVDK